MNKVDKELVNRLLVTERLNASYEFTLGALRKLIVVAETNDVKLCLRNGREYKGGTDIDTADLKKVLGFDTTDIINDVIAKAREEKEV